MQEYFGKGGIVNLQKCNHGMMVDLFHMCLIFLLLLYIPSKLESKHWPASLPEVQVGQLYLPLLQMLGAFGRPDLFKTHKIGLSEGEKLKGSQVFFELIVNPLL